MRVFPHGKPYNVLFVEVFSKTSFILGDTKINANRWLERISWDYLSCRNIKARLVHVFFLSKLGWSKDQVAKNNACTDPPTQNQTKQKTTKKDKNLPKRKDERVIWAFMQKQLY
jgi:hypothetical protein